MGFINLGTRNKATFFEYGSAYSFLNTKLPITRYEVPVFLGVGEGKPNKHCHHSDVIAATVKLLKKEFEEGKYSKDFFEQIIRAYMRKFEILKEICKSSDFINDDNGTLAEKFHTVTDAMMESHKSMLLALKTMYLDDFYTDLLRRVLTVEECKDPAKVMIIKAVLLTSLDPSIAQEEEQALYEIEKSFVDEGLEKSKESFDAFCKRKNIKEKLSNLVADYGWFHMEYIFYPLTIEDYKKQLWERITASAITERSPTEALEEIRQKQETFFTAHNNVEKLKQWTLVLQKFAYVLDHTKVIMVKSRYVALPLFKEVAKRIGITEPDLLYLVLPEITNLLCEEKKADKNLIKKRKKHRVVHLENGTISVYEGGEAVRKAEELMPEDSVSEKSEIKGVVGYPGKVKGKVILIRSVKDKNKFKKGGVLVTHDGTAELTMFLKEAGAIVTNEGGMICHAAIVAREMKTPCIVGTKNATKMLNDGDEVEVNADEGIVKILAKKKDKPQ